MDFYILYKSDRWIYNCHFKRPTAQTYHYPGGCKFKGASSKNRGGRSAAPSTRLLIRCIWKEKTKAFKINSKANIHLALSSLQCIDRFMLYSGLFYSW